MSGINKLFVAVALLTTELVSGQLPSQFNGAVTMTNGVTRSGAISTGRHADGYTVKPPDSAGVVDNGYIGGDGSRMYMFRGRHRKKIYGWWVWYFHDGRVEQLLLAFIQRHYPTDQSLANKREMMGYLAGRAVELSPPR